MDQSRISEAEVDLERRETAMSCQQDQEQLAQFALGFLAPEKMEELQSHLQVCPFCTQRMQDYQLMNQKLSAASFRAPDREFLYCLERQMNLMPPVRESRVFDAVALVGTGCVLVVGVLFLVFWTDWKWPQFDFHSATALNSGPWIWAGIAVIAGAALWVAASAFERLGGLPWVKLKPRAQ